MTAVCAAVQDLRGSLDSGYLARPVALDTPLCHNKPRGECVVRNGIDQLLGGTRQGGQFPAATLPVLSHGLSNAATTKPTGFRHARQVPVSIAVLRASR